MCISTLVSCTHRAGRPAWGVVGTDLDGVGIVDVGLWAGRVLLGLGEGIFAAAFLCRQEALDVLVVVLHACHTGLPQQRVRIHGHPGAWKPLEDLHLKTGLHRVEQLLAQSMHLRGALLDGHPSHLQPFQDGAKVTRRIAKAHGHGGGLQAAQQREKGGEHPGVQHDVPVVGHGVELGQHVCSQGNPKQWHVSRNKSSDTNFEARKQKGTDERSRKVDGEEKTHRRRCPKNPQVCLKES